jgi:CBS domain containing-hemolysin-like protein
MVTSLIDLKSVKVSDCMIRWAKIFTLRLEDTIDDSVIEKIAIKGFSRIPIIRDNSVEGNYPSNKNISFKIQYSHFIFRK